MQLKFNAQTYLKAAEFYTKANFEAKAAYSDFFLIPVLGDMQYFPRTTTEVKALERSLDLLKSQLNEIITMLKALAVIAEPKNEITVLPVIELMDIQVEPYVNYSELKNKQPPKTGDDELIRIPGKGNSAKRKQMKKNIKK